MPSQAVFFGVGAAATLLLALIAFVMVRLVRPSVQKGARRREAIHFGPMRRLLREDDFDFLRSQPGYRPEVAQRLRARRLSIFRGYLGQLENEFNQLHRDLRILTLYAQEDRPEVSRLLVRERMVFSLRMMEARIRLAFFWMGVKPVDVSGMVETITTMRQYVGSMGSIPSLATVAG